MSDLDLLAYLATKYDAEVKRSKGHQMEITEQREVTALFDRMHERSGSARRSMSFHSILEIKGGSAT